jgi:hypothetical protein
MIFMLVSGTEGTHRLVQTEQQKVSNWEAGSFVQQLRGKARKAGN